MLKTLKQNAKIVAVNGDTITCTIVCAEACAGCAANALCGAGNEQKTITLVDISRCRNVGDDIEIEVSTKTGLRAIAMAYLIPVVLIIATLLITQSIAISELWQGLITLGVVVIYYIIIKIFGIGRSISITIVE